MLARLKAECDQDEPCAPKVAGALSELLAWLAAPGSNTDPNCRAVDTFVCVQILPSIRRALPGELQAILEDVGGALHDTHTAPHVAENFYSTPEQLLSRTRRVMENFAPPR